MKPQTASGLFKKILITNRGEIACRIIRTCQSLGVSTVAIYSEADRDALHVRLADDAFHIGKATSEDSYLNHQRILETAIRCQADSIHPGYGFLAENDVFAEACLSKGIKFIGPRPESIREMGSKSRAKQLMQEAGVPVVPGYHGDKQDYKTLRNEAEKLGFPLLIKPVAGGGGRGMRVVRQLNELEEALTLSRSEAKNAFGDDNVLLERFIEGPRHIEFQIFGDQYGNFVHLHERECSIQRRHQKILEESPSPFLDETLRKQMAEASLKAANAVQYLGAGTVEFIVGEDRSFYFIEMNTRLQVEHPVTEMRTGLDLVEWQIRVASGEKLPLDQDQIRPKGHSIEVRVCAENPERGFLPSSGLLELYDYADAPSASGSSLIRIDSGFEQKDRVGIHYDSMLAKLIVHGEDRDKALITMQHALKTAAIIGPETNLGFLQKLVSHPQFLDGKADTLFIDACLPELLQNEETTPEWIYWACAIDFLQSEQESARQKAANSSNPHSPWHFYDNWRMGREEPFLITFRDEQNHLREVRLIERDSGFEVFSGKECIPLNFQQQGRDVVIRFENSNGTTVKHSLRIFRHQNDILAVHETGRIQLTLESGREHELETEHTDSQLKAPMPGNIIRVCVKNGEKVNRGQTLMVLEAMKMEHPILAPENGRVERLLFQEGDVVKTDEQLIEFEAE